MDPWNVTFTVYVPAGGKLEAGTKNSSV